MKLTTKDVKTPESREFRMLNNRVGLFNTTYSDFKRYGIPKAQLIIADIPYNLGKNAYGSNPVWYQGGDNKNGESDKAGETFFVTDENFKPAEFMHFASQMLRPEPKGKIGGGQECNKRAMYDYLLRVYAAIPPNRTCEKVRIQELHKLGVS